MAVVASSSANNASHGAASTAVNGSSNFPLSARKAQPLDLKTVERRGTQTQAREVSRSNRLFGLEEAPTYTPTAEEFRDPFEYMRKIAPEGQKYGIVKIIPPENWNPDFAIDTEFSMRLGYTSEQALNSVEGGTRANLNYLDQLAKFHRSRGNNLNRFPSVDKRPLDLYKLKKAVETRGGFDRVCKGKKWAEIGRDLGYSGKIMSSLSTSLKNSYQKGPSEDSESQANEPPLKSTPDYDWHCPRCLVGDGEFGFDEGGVYSLKQFQQRDQDFRQDHFRDKQQFDPVLNAKKPPNEDDVEREFWKLVENVTDKVPEVEYGADVHVTTHGSGFPTLEKEPRNSYSTDPWNLNILPLHSESLFRHIKSDISGMTVPWLYVGMCFSTFCWHNEDHYSYSANYQHFGATKTWYGVPGEDAEKFENAMREAVPELFETQPDLLFQLVTLLTPEHLKRAGVRVYALDQRAGQFVITFPQAYHAGFNHGFNFNEAVNFAPPDWEPKGEDGVQRLQDFRRQPCFSHDELLLTAAGSKEVSIKTAKWLGPALQRMYDKESTIREAFLSRHKQVSMKPCKIEEGGSASKNNCEIGFEIDERDLPEDDYLCSYCKGFAYLSRFVCRTSGKVACLKHAGIFECCPTTEDYRFSGTNGDHTVFYRITNADLDTATQRIVEKATLPDLWTAELDKYLAEEPTPELKKLRRLLSEGEKIPWGLPGHPELKRYVDRCNEWVERATAFTTRKQQHRRKNERPSRKSTTKQLMEQEEREREIRKVDTLKKLLAEAEDISFECPEIAILQEHMDSIKDFQKRARVILADRNMRTTPTQELDDLLELGRSFNLDIPEVEELDKCLQQLKWYDEVRTYRDSVHSLQDITEFIKRGQEMGIAETEMHMLWLKEEKSKGEVWEKTAKEVMAMEMVNYQQLDALSQQAKHLPVSPDTLAKVEAILKKQRDAQDQIKALYDRSKDPDFKNRPWYKEVREAMEALNELNSKPPGTIDLEREQKRHEDWMRRGKKLFGKANAPLHILQQHMDLVCARNEACFDLNDQPRMPVEPASREHTPASGDENGAGSTRDVFCICRKPEAGMMIECELCHEWYHGKCLKIARGKVKEDDKYTCPICDYRVKIPRDATRPKLEDLEGWQEDIPGLPFQPEEEKCLDKIINTAQEFRSFIASYVNPLLSSPDELTTQRFYLRKLEGADILLAQETNFFRQELHKWAPVAPEPPPKVEYSLSTRKPRPTKQQKMMAQLGIDNPDDLPQHLHGEGMGPPPTSHAEDALNLTAGDGEDKEKEEDTSEFLHD
ncbi:putative phd transcription factor protein [Neofusicoccum parvum UCRNP2]|uniref:Putative phd transcription factor protein n=1 Tax=Botryosphaeria parva (strain UCR-NP2) TaxID=1287680 RepID=R1GGD4_BOTPV|nr:putative phd transcription factor protein [Neofusicoccum parvum UCRNP2]